MYLHQSAILHVRQADFVDLIKIIWWTVLDFLKPHARLLQKKFICYLYVISYVFHKKLKTWNTLRLDKIRSIVAWKVTVMIFNNN